MILVRYRSLFLQACMQKYDLARALVARRHWKGVLRHRAFSRWLWLQQASIPWRAAVNVQIKQADARRRFAHISHCWHAWLDRCRQQQVWQHHLKRSRRHWYQHMLVKALKSWKVWLVDVFAEQCCTSAALQHWRGARLYDCFLAWRKCFQDSVRERYSL